MKVYFCIFSLIIQVTILIYLYYYYLEHKLACYEPTTMGIGCVIKVYIVLTLMFEGFIFYQETTASFLIQIVSITYNM